MANGTAVGFPAQPDPQADPNQVPKPAAPAVPDWPTRAPARDEPPSQPDTPPPPPQTSPDAAFSLALTAILDEHVEWVAREFPEQSSKGGDDRYAHLLTDVTPAAVERRLAEVRDRLDRLRALTAGATPTEDQSIDARILELDLEYRLADAPYYPEQLPVTARAGVQVWLPQLPESVPLDTTARRESYVRRLEAMGEHLDAQVAQMRAGMAAGRVPPRVVMLGSAEQALAHATPELKASPQGSRFYTPFAAAPADDALAARALAAVRDVVIPAFDRLGVFLRDEYIPACRETLGESSGVDGPASYAVKVRLFTTTDLTPQQVHETGLSEVARLRAEMFTVIARSDFPDRDRLAGDELMRAFLRYLRTDPRFYYTDKEDLLRGYRDIAKRVDAELPRFFGRLPRLPYGVRELPAFMAPASPPAYYYPGSLDAGLAGNMVANTYRLDQRPTYDMVALTLHEACPGHHLQIALAQEAQGHPVRTIADFTAFVEGWALYAERLGLEMEGGTGRGGEGLYRDPYDDFGRLSFEMWRACRLVVDTGIHALGWSRQQAIDYMLAHTALAPLAVEREVDRYIGWPGQATAYKIGELRVSATRRRAEAALGARFNLREFHDVVLAAGATPLDVLDERVDRWIASRGAGEPR
ncbi:MAG: DUF885 domain-containing protein [Phycisphaeraceae bacterium]|nr:MAG: DUF885 domain-containing protein [Phycisphaeraceae bacterium]